MTDRETRRCVVYSRVSTEGQAANGHGLEAQRERGAGYVQMRGWPGEPEYVDDAGVSGKVAPAKRPGLGPALARLDAGEVDVLVTASLSRLGWRGVDVLKLAERAAEHGWGLVVLDLQLDTSTPTGRAMFGMLAVMAQLEREQAVERTKDGLAVARSKGKRFGRPASEATRRAGRRAQELRAGGATYQRIADVLGAEGYLTAGGAKSWNAQQARRAMLTVQQDEQAASQRRAFRGEG